MMKRIGQWLVMKWRPADRSMAQAYSATFATSYGQQVLQHLLDTVYCQVYEGNDPMQMAMHNGRRSVIQEILENIDHAENSLKYQVLVEGEQWAGRTS